MTFKACSCCGRGYDSVSWAALHLLGVQPVPGYQSLEMRLCVCGTTLGVEVYGPSLMRSAFWAWKLKKTVGDNDV